MNRFYSFILLFCSSMFLFGSQPLLSGFNYGTEKEPTGKEWESPQNLSLNKEQPHAWFFSFADKESARKVLPEHSAYWQSLNGDWKFNWAPDPDSRPKDFYTKEYDVSNWDNIAVPSNWNVFGIQKDGSLKYGHPIYVNQPVIFQHSVKVDDWRGGVMRTPPEHWTTYKHRNEIGSYRRDFDIPTNWDGREVYVDFDGVDSFFYLWINGHYVGFSKNSRGTASFNISQYLQKGTNTIAVEVYRSSDGSFLEAQDMFRLPGIFRTVALHSKPKVQIQDLVVKPDLDSQYINGSLALKANIKNFTNKKVNKYKLVYSLYENKLYSDENTLVANSTVELDVDAIEKNASAVDQIVTMEIPAPKKWSAEFPHRYTLVAELKDAKNKTIETVSTTTGFVKVEIKDTPASEDEFGLKGRYFFVNGKTIKMKGVNRHESHPEVGHAITRKMMEDEVMLMKRANINHVRNSHYTMDPYWYYLCNKYGLYLEDEANIESHQYYYGEASLSHPVEWKDAHVARVMEMVHANINNPSIIIWSLGNEAGPGKNFVHAYDALKKVDQRPVQYERNNDIVDMGSNQYPSIAWMRNAVKGDYNIKYPFHVSEYAHSMGNAAGNLIDYWEAIESTNFFMGGAIWDWVDQAIYNYDKKTGTRYLGYGGDFGDTPNDGQFVMNGIIFADREPKPQYYEVKKVYQHIGVKATDISVGDIEIFNKYYFKDLSDYTLAWTLLENGTAVENGTQTLPTIEARKKAKLTIPYKYNLKDDAEYFLTIQFKLKADEVWAQKGYVQAEEQLFIQSATTKPLISEVAKGSGDLKSSTTGDILTINNDKFEVKFDTKEGTIFSLKYGNNLVIADGNGPKVDAFRAFVNNDNWAYSQWFQNGLHNLKHKVISSNVINKKDGTLVLAFTLESQAPNGAKIHGGTSSGHNTIEELTDKPFDPSDFKLTTNQLWTIYQDGSIELQSSFTSNNENVVLPRLGYFVKVPQQYSKFSYYGRGPVENYADRKTSQFVGKYTSTPAKEYTNFPKPQDMGNHEEVRWSALTNDAGKGIVFVSSDEMSVAALQYSALDLMLAPHIYELPKAGDTYLHLNLGTTGLGGNSCGQGPPLMEDRVKAGHHTMGFIIRPAQADLSAVGNVISAGTTPLAIVRDQVGAVEIKSSGLNAGIKYTVNNQKKVMDYTSAIEFRDGGTITAWTAENPQVKVTSTFEKVESIKTEVIFASSEEVGHGDAKNLTDGDPSTIWHTMYSVTVAKHPHWVDLDAKEVRTIKGFTYLPRSGGGTGTIKDYTIHLSTDGENWGEPILKASFEAGGSEKRVMFDKPIKARYIRFTALSAQNGQDYASGAELTILAD